MNAHMARLLARPADVPAPCDHAPGRRGFAPARRAEQDTSLSLCASGRWANGTAADVAADMARALAAAEAYAWRLRAAEATARAWQVTP